MDNQPLVALTTMRAAALFYSDHGDNEMTDLPFISAVCVTYGRVHHLEEALACFLAQDYKGKSELVIFNTCPKQQFNSNVIPTAEIRIHNCAERPSSLGQARNMAIGMCKGDIVVTWDDDDVFLSHHLRMFAEHFGDNAWIWFDRQFSAMGDFIREISPGSCPLFAFKKSVWEAIGGYPALSCGEDRQLISRISGLFKGERVRTQNEELSFIYRWGNSVYHASGEGDDNPRKIPVHTRVAADLQRRINRGLEPTGQIILQPKLKIDWEHKARDFIAAKAIPTPRESICIVELGRYGDIVNILPICRRVAERVRKPYLMVSRQFADLLDGVSYVEPYPVDLTHDRLKEALEMARREFGFVMQGQIWGTNFHMDHECDAFNRESWRMLGFAHEFESEEAQWWPWFDKRDQAREAAAIAKLMGDKPTLLINVTSSHSSPFPEGPKVLAWIRAHYSDVFHILDMAEVRLERIYDVIGLMERAHGLVSIDTALIHFAACCQVPTIAIRNPKEWLGSAVRPCVNLRLATDYDAVGTDPQKTIGPALDAIRLDADKFVPTVKGFPPLLPPPTRTVYHVVERHNDPFGAMIAEKQRKTRAQATWDRLYQSGVVPVHVWEYPRTAKGIGDKRSLPYLKDILKAGMEKAQPWDIIMWTNDDNHLHALLPSLLQFYVGIYDAVGSHRCEFRSRPVPTQHSNPQQIAGATKVAHIGRDLFAFTKQWLVDNWDEIPDFILGASEFDLCLACMIRVQKGFISTRQNLEDIIWPCELPKGFVSHEYHFPHWNRPENTDSAPSQKHNRKLFYEWSKTNLPSLKFTPIYTI